MKPSHRSLFTTLMFITTAVLFLSCEKNASDRFAPPNTGAEVQVFKDVRYAVNKGLNEKHVYLKLDIYIPSYNTTTE